jgi:hypothetical protein
MPGDVAVAGGASGGDRAELGVYLAAAVHRGGAVGGRCRRGGVAASDTGRCSIRCANCYGCSARRLFAGAGSARGAGSGPAKKTVVAVALARSRGHAVKRAAEVLGVARSNLFVQTAPQRSPATPRSAASARGRAIGRDQEHHRRPADLRLSAHPCPDPASSRPGRWPTGEGEADLSGDEGAPALARTPYRDGPGTPP